MGKTHRYPSLTEVRVEPARLDDAGPILDVHRAAVCGTASGWYPPEIIESWSAPPTDARIAKMRQVIAGGEEIVVVARHGQRVVGFGSIVPGTGELRAVYVHPDFGRCGVGSKVVGELENLARQMNVRELWMDASINAESFYLRHGFEIVHRGKHRLSSGDEMACVRMRKRFEARGPGEVGDERGANRVTPAG